MIKQFLKGFVLVPAFILWAISEMIIESFQLRYTPSVLGQTWVDGHGKLTAFVDPMLSYKSDNVTKLNVFGTMFATVVYIAMILVVVI